MTQCHVQKRAEVRKKRGKKILEHMHICRHTPCVWSTQCEKRSFFSAASKRKERSGLQTRSSVYFFCAAAPKVRNITQDLGSKLHFGRQRGQKTNLQKSRFFQCILTNFASTGTSVLEALSTHRYYKKILQMIPS